MTKVFLGISNELCGLVRLLAALELNEFLRDSSELEEVNPREEEYL